MITVPTCNRDCSRGGEGKDPIGWVSSELRDGSSGGTCLWVRTNLGVGGEGPGTRAVGVLVDFGPKYWADLPRDVL